MALLQYIDFEVPDWGEFASVIAGTTISQSPEAAFPDRPVGEGLGMGCAMVAASNGVATTRNFAERAELWVGFWLNLRGGYSASNNHAIRVVYEASGGPFRLLFRYKTATGRWECELADPGGTAATAVGLPEDRWCHVAFGIGMGGGSGYRRVVIDGVERFSQTALSNAGTIAALNVGARNWSGAPTVSYWLDELKIGQAWADVQPTAVPPPANAPGPERTLIVTRLDDPDSETWGQYYRAARGVPHANCCRLPCSADETLTDYAAFLAQVELPLAEWLADNSAVAAHVTTIVLGHRVPGGFADGGTVYSAASRIARLGHTRVPGSPNPLYDPRAESLGDAPVGRAELDAAGVSFLVGRIDGADLGEAAALVDRADALAGRIIAGDGFLDTTGASPQHQVLLNDWLDSLAAQRLKRPIIATDTPDTGGEDWFVVAASEVRIGLSDGDALVGQSPPGADGPSPWPLLESLRRGATFGEAFARGVPLLDWTATPLGDPLATVRFPHAGLHVYRGRKAGQIDFAALIAAAPAGASSIRLPAWPALDWPAGSRWRLAVRPVDVDGIEYADPGGVLGADFDDAGALASDRPDAVRDLRVRPTSAARLRVNWRCAAAAGRPAPAGFQVFLGPAHGQTLDELLTGEPADSIALDPSGAYEWTSGPLAAGVPWRVAVRAAGESGTAGAAVHAVAFARPARVVPIDMLIAEVR